MINDNTLLLNAESVALILAADNKMGIARRHGLRFRELDNIRTSIVAYTNWCDFGARIKLTEPRKPADDTEASEATAKGTIFHKMMEESAGRRFTHEQAFMDSIKPFEKPGVGWTREFEGIDGFKCVVSGHPDDFQVLPSRRVSHIEYKTTAVKYRKSDNVPNLDFIERFKLCMARFQVQIYTWIFEPIYKEIGYFPDSIHQVSYFDSDTFHHLKDYVVEYREKDVEANLSRALGIIKHPEFCIAPKQFKCRMCYPELKEKCPLWLSENGQSAN